MRDGASIYNLQYIPVRLADYMTTAVAIDSGGTPPDIERFEDCPRGYKHNCSVCSHVHLYVNTLSSMFQCLELTRDSLTVRCVLSQQGNDSLSAIISITFRDMTIMDVRIVATELLINEIISSGGTKVLPYSHCESLLPGLSHLFAEQFKYALLSNQITLEKQALKSS